MIFRPCALVPSYNHHLAVGQVVASLRSQGMPVYVIDDGSGPQAQTVLAALHDPDQGVHVLRMDQNEGKGSAVTAGMKLAAEAGYTHAVQVDADGQHDAEALPEMLRLAQKSPEALVSGQPIYDDSIPKSRKIGRLADPRLGLD